MEVFWNSTTVQMVKCEDQISLLDWKIGRSSFNSLWHAVVMVENTMNTEQEGKILLLFLHQIFSIVCFLRLSKGISEMIS